jgi:hypothetical protein
VRETHFVIDTLRREAVAGERLLCFVFQRIAPGGTRQRLMLRRSPLRADFTVVLAPGSRR